MGTKSNFVQGAVVKFKELENFSEIEREVTLQELIEMKIDTVNKIKALSNSLLSLPKLDLEKTKEIINKIEALQYNLTIFKQLNAIANVGSPEKNMLGINGSIYQASDLKALNHTLSSLVVKVASANGPSDLVEYLNTKRRKNARLIEEYYRTQTMYNKSMKIIVRYLDVKL